ncbi:MAG: hypothetical protein WCG60_02055 [bacterium]|jgi:hypothetical protein
MNQEKKCCVSSDDKAEKGLLSGFIYGLLPHSFCLAFAFLSIIGAITASAVFKKILLVPNIFNYLVIISILLATISVYLYLKKIGCLCKSGIKNNWKYISTIYSATVIINLVFFYGVIPILANINTKYVAGEQSGLSEVSIKVDIPCTGHSFLIIDEVNKIEGVSGIKFNSPDEFVVKYNPQNTSPLEIVSLDVFSEFKARIQ